MKNIVFKAAKEAGKVLMEHYNKIDRTSVDTKKANDFVTFVDKKSEKVIVEILKKEFPHHHIMAEEEEWDNNPPDSQWIIDPLDGTKNYIHGFPVFAVSIALEVEKDIKFGLVYDPTREEIFWAEKGKGAFLNDKKIEVSENQNLDYALIATGFPFRWPQYVDVYMECFKDMFKQISDMRRAGAAALDICYTACGRLDGYWELGLSPWDVAAGDLISREAGAVISDFNGEDKHIYSGKIVVANSHLHPSLVNIIKGHFGTGVKRT